MKRNSVSAAVCGAAAAHRLLSVGTLICAAAYIVCHYTFAKSLNRINLNTSPAGRDCAATAAAGSS